MVGGHTGRSVVPEMEGGFVGGFLVDGRQGLIQDGVLLVGSVVMVNLP